MENITKEIREEVLHDFYYDLARAAHELHAEADEQDGTYEAEYFARLAKLGDRMLENHGKRTTGGAK